MLSQPNLAEVGVRAELGKRSYKIKGDHTRPFKTIQENTFAKTIENCIEDWRGI